MGKFLFQSLFSRLNATGRDKAPGTLLVAAIQNKGPGTGLFIPIPPQSKQIDRNS
jgi:hypothetical protein